MNKHVLTGLAITALALASASTSALANNAAYIVDGGGCGMFDQNGGFLIADADHSVVTHSGKGNLKCAALTANDSGKVIKFTGFACGTYAGTTYRSWEVIDTLGNATLTCQVH